jgi:O-antigen ligase
MQPFVRSNLDPRGALAAGTWQTQKALPARIRPHLLAAGVLVTAASAGLAVAHGQGNGFLLAYVAAMLFMLPVLAGRPELLIALVVALCVVAVGPLASAEGSGILHPASARLPLLIAASAAVLLLHRGPRLPVLAVLLYSSLLLFLAVGIPFSPDPSAGIEYLLKLCVPLGVAGAIASLGSDGVGFAETLGLGALGVTLLVDYGMLAVGAGYYAHEGTELLRFGGLSGSGPSTGFVLSLLGVFSLVLWLRSNRLLPLILWGASFPILLVTFTRSGIAAWLIGSMTALLIARRTRFMIVFIITAVVVLLGNSALADRSTEEGGGWGAVITSIRERGFAGINTTGRADLWDENIQRIAEHPLAGSGLGAAEYYTERLTSGVLGQAHSEYLTLLVGGGVVALSLWILTWIVLARSVWLGAGRLAVSCIVSYALLAAVDSPISNYAQGGAMIGIALGWALATNALESQVDGDSGRIEARRY